MWVAGDRKEGQGSGSGYVEMSGKWTTEDSTVSLRGLAALQALGQPHAPCFVACLIGNFREVRVGIQVSKDIVGVPTGQVAEASINP